MLVITDRAQCSGCGACASLCPKDCITMVPDNEGFLYPKVNKELCINCGLCTKRCPVINKTESQNKEIQSYAARAKDEEILLKSSSGGMFSLFAKSVLSKGGVVFGAAFCQDFSVKHTFIQSEKELPLLQGSKYVQSQIGESYIQAKAFLEEGRHVLFTGTPCQIGGLYAFLGKDYDTLITQDIICHGIPSPMVWKSYVSTLEQEADSKLSSVRFRDKKTGWKNYSLNFSFENGTQYSWSHRDDSYFKSFLMNLCLRPSCHQCAFKDKHRQSDITLADFWGIENVCQELDHRNGTSFVSINSQKGKEFFTTLSQKTVSKQVDFEKAISFNSSMINSSPQNKNREKFMKTVERYGFISAKKLLQMNFFEKIKRKIVSIIKK